MPRRPVGSRKQMVKRATGQGSHTRDHGYQPPSRVNVRVIASIQPMNSKVAETLPEGLRTSASIVIYSTSPLKTVEMNENYFDLLCYDDLEYEIHESKKHDKYAPIPHYRYVGVASNGTN